MNKNDHVPIHFITFNIIRLSWSPSYLLAIPAFFFFFLNEMPARWQIRPLSYLSVSSSAPLEFWSVDPGIHDRRVQPFFENGRWMKDCIVCFSKHSRQPAITYWSVLQRRRLFKDPLSLMHLTVLAGWEERNWNVFDMSRFFCFFSFKKGLYFCVPPITLSLCQTQTRIQPRAHDKKGNLDVIGLTKPQLAWFMI